MKKKIAIEGVLAMPVVIIPAGGRQTICAASHRRFRANRLIVARPYPTLFLEQVTIGTLIQGLYGPGGICLEALYPAKAIDEVLARLRAGQTFDGYRGAVNEGLISAVKEMTRTISCATTLEIAMYLTMSVHNRGDAPVELACHWQGEELE